MINSNLRLVVLDRKALSGTRPSARRPHPGGRDRPEPCLVEKFDWRRGLQVLDLRDLVDPPGLPAGDREPVDDDPRPRARQRAAAQAGRARRTSCRRTLAASRRARSSPKPAGLSMQHVDEALDAADAPVSLNAECRSEGDAELGDLFGDPTATDPLEDAAESLKRQTVQKALAGSAGAAASHRRASLRLRRRDHLARGDRQGPRPHAGARAAARARCARPAPARAPRRRFRGRPRKRGLTKDAGAATASLHAGAGRAVAAASVCCAASSARDPEPAAPVSDRSGGRRTDGLRVRLEGPVGADERDLEPSRAMSSA